MAVIDASEADAVDVVGYSMGSWTASRLLDREPRLRSVALCGSSSQFVEGIDQSPYGDDLGAWLRGCGHAFQTNTWDDPSHEWVRQVAVLDPDHDFPSIAAALLGFGPVPAERLSGARVPVLVLNGGGDDAGDGAKRLAALIPGAEAALSAAAFTAPPSMIPPTARLCSRSCAGAGRADTRPVERIASASKLRIEFHAAGGAPEHSDRVTVPIG